jgi:hypothetical protein
MAVIDDPKIWKKLGKQILFIVPSAFLATIVGLKGASAILVEHYTQVFSLSVVCCVCGNAHVCPDFKLRVKIFYSVE